MNLSNRYFFNDVDLFDEFNVFDGKGLIDAQLLLTAVTTYTKNWADENGTERDFNTKVFPTKNMDLPFYMRGNSASDILEKYNLFKQFLYTNVNFVFKAFELGRSFEVKYKSMPTFDSLSVLQGEGYKYISFSISVSHEAPEVFKDFNGDVISLIYPPDIADAPIDFNNYTFELVGDYVIMTGLPNIWNFMNLNGNPLSDYGLFLDAMASEELLKMPNQKGEIALKFETRTIELPFVLMGNGEADFISKYYSLCAFLLDKGYFNLDVSALNKRFTLTYSNMPSFEKLSVVKGNTGKVICKFILSLYDDEPTIEGGLAIYDGKFIIDSNGNLIYSHSPQFDDDISFELDENGNLIVNIL